jgi:hypothetical protein
MGFAKVKIFLLALILHSAHCYGQQENYINSTFSNTRFHQTDSGLQIIEKQLTKCRQKIENSFFIPNQAIVVKAEKIFQEPIAEKEKLLTIHGNVTYYFNYRSYIDTPFAENNIMQHAVQTRLDIKLKEKYPFTVYLTSRRSNSDYFSNATDVSFQFHQAQMLENIKRDIRDRNEKLLYNKSLSLTPSQLYQREKDGILKDVGNFKNIDAKGKLSELTAEKQKELQEKFGKLYEDYKSKMNKLEALKAFAKSTSGAQEQVEEKERQLRETASEPLKNAQAIIEDKETALRNYANKNKDSVENKANNFLVKNKTVIKADSIKNRLTERIATKQQQYEKLQKEVAQSEQALQAYQKKITDSLQAIRKLVNKITDKSTLDEYLHKTEGSVYALPKMQRLLLSIKQIGIGRSWIDYSELTVKNISLSGFNIEANPNNIYFAAAAGKVNYRFRDYLVKGSYTGSNQSVGLIRAGFGKKEKNNIILTYYTGQKALLAQTNPTDAATQKIAGFSVETRKKIDEHNYLTAEYARSTTSALQNKVLDFTTNSNEAFSIKLFSDYGTTKVNGYYRKTGEAFQSFTLFPTNNKQDAWMLRATQAIWKKRILVDAAIRKNDFNSPIAAPNFSNTNVFKSFQVTARIPKYPFVSAGYYPSSQLTLSDNNVLYENRYNTLNTIISHSYYVGKLSMNSNATFTKFYNSGSDTGFIYFNASTLTLNHSVNLQKFVLQGILTIIEQSYLKQTTIEPVLTYNLKNTLSVSGSIKWNRINHIETLWGGTAGLNLYINKIGTLQIQYDKIYLPSYSRNLLPVDMGRLTFSREF